MAHNIICTSCLRALRFQARGEINLYRSTPKQRPSFPSNGFTNITSHQLSSSRSATQQKAATHPPPPPQHDKSPSSDAISNFAASVRKRSSLKNTTEPYIAYGSTEDLFRECNKQCNYTIPSRLENPPPEEAPQNSAGEDVGEGEGWWYQPKTSGGLGLDVTFNTWAQVMFLHMYMLTVRLRCFPAQHAKIWHQNLLDHFFYAAEDRMEVWHGITSRGRRNGYLKDLWQQWRGILWSYDEGLIKGDAVLATAIWRNVFKASVDTDVQDLALVTAYMRSQLRMLDEVKDEKLAAGEVQFADPAKVKALLVHESPRMKQKPTEDDLSVVQELQEKATKKD